MSRIGKQTIIIKSGVEVKVDKGEFTHVSVKGPKGELSFNFNREIDVVVTGSEINVKRPNDEIAMKALHGTTRSLLANMIIGVSDGFRKDLEIKGVGYKAELKGTDLYMNIGYSHPVIIKPLEGIKFIVTDQVNIAVEGYDKQVVGQMAALIREVRKPEPYKGKGIKYKDEQIRRKAGKSAKAK